MDLLLSVPSYSVRSGRENFIFYGDAINLESMADAATFRKWVMRPVASGNLFCLRYSAVSDT